MLPMSTPLVNLRWKVLLIVAASLIPLSSGRPDTFTAEEQALLDKNRTMEMYKPDEHSRHFIARIESAADPKTGEKRKISKDAQAVLCFVFGIEDAKPARDEGRSMAECQYKSIASSRIPFRRRLGQIPRPIFHQMLRTGRRERLQRSAKSAAKARRPVIEQLMVERDLRARC